jgi:uncharacterized protein YndB with AHSA1/START domain
MLIKISLAVLCITGLFAIYVSTRAEKFNYSVTMPIHAPVEKVFPYLSDLKLGGEWSPFEKVDPNLKKEFIGSSKMTFEGNSEAGAGSVEITKVIPNERVELRLIMTAPLKADNKVTYAIVPLANGDSQLTWSMSGDNGFLGKLVSVIIDCEAMIQGQFTKGIVNLKTIVEK